MSTHSNPPQAPGPARRRDSWHVIGPGGGGTMLAPTIDPHDPNLVLIHCDMTGAYITLDGGLSWRMLNLRTVVNAFAFDPLNPDVVYAGNMALWRSEDRGATWRMVWPDPARNTVEHMRGDHASPVLTTEDPSYPFSGRHASISAIAVDPTDSAHICMTLGPAQDGLTLLYESHDHGQSWHRAADFGRERVRLLSVRPEGSEHGVVVRVLADSRLQTRVNGLWRRGVAPARVIDASAGWDSRRQEPLLYATTPTGSLTPAIAGGVHASEDGGRSWRCCIEEVLRDLGWVAGSAVPQFGAIACCADEPRVAYVAFEGLRTGDGPEHLYNGIAKTVDGGRNWQVVHRESNAPSANLEGSWIEGRAVDGYPNIWFDGPESLGVAPTDPDICYASDLFRTYRTLDGGRSWQQVNSVQAEGDRWTTRGLDVTTCYGVHFDPFDARHIYITYTDIGLFQSADGGESWIGSTEGIPNRWRNTTYWITFDPEVPKLAWGAFGFNHDLPRPKMWRGQDPATYEGGVAVSTDGGLQWALSNGGMPESAVTHILLDPDSPVGSRTLYACGFGRGVYRSEDNGKTWQPKNAGIEGDQPFAWRISRAGDGTLYLVVARRAESGPVDPAEMGALFRSTDRAEHWERIPLPHGVTGPTALSIDPTDDRCLYLSAWGLGGDGDDTGGGVFLSADGGATWRCIFDDGQHVYDTTIDLADPRTLYVCGFDAAAWRSTDGGETWSRLNGYNFKWGHRVTVDPLDRGQVYITTFGGSVWHGSAAGDPDAAADIVGWP